jgi:hypothetical protein
MKILDRPADFLARIHDELALAHDRLADWLTAHEQRAGILPAFHGNLIAVAVEFH